MGFLALLLVVLAAWLIWTGRLQRMTATDGIMLGLAIVGAIMAARGQPVIGGAPLAGAAIYALRRMSASRRARPAAAPSPTDNSALREARALLGLDEHADADAIRAAHRRLIAKTHPDAGGTQALAEKINQARDILLRHATERSGSHS
ncbi:MAG: DnaJ domain-containing protein [Sphingobium sp.]|jgi:hypothetical protein|nr:DnaJ domain-containing protein [Sphingobium sp.]MCP5400641.1 DnaJ domain-containing protein [Sphingomonas sp.]